jgi:hypothetical protein
MRLAATLQQIHSKSKAILHSFDLLWICCKCNETFACTPVTAKNTGVLQSQSRENAALNKKVLSDCLKCVKVCAERMVSGREFQARGPE